MTSERRRHERFPLNITAKRIGENNREVAIQLIEVSVGGCFTSWFEEAHPGYVFVIEFPKLNGDWISLLCRVRYRYLNVGVGVEFVDISYAEQEPIAETIMNYMWEAGLPEQNPFEPPKSIARPRTLETLESDDLMFDAAWNDFA